MIKSNTPDVQYLSYERNIPSSAQLSRLNALQKKQESLWQSIRQNVSEAKKQFKKLNEQLKEELSNKLKTKAEVVEEILRTLDSKIEFVIESCEKYGNRIMQHVNGKVVMEDTHGYNQKFQLITEKMRVLEQRLFGFKQNEEELKSRLEIMKDKNNQLTEEYRVLSLRSNQRISQLEHQLREKEHQLRQKDHHLRQKTDELRKKDNNDAIKFTFVHPTPTPPPPLQSPQQIIHKAPSQQSSGVAHYNPGTIIQQTQPKKQNIQKPIPVIAMTAGENKSQPLVNNNSIEIRPDFFRTNTELNSTKGINLRSIRDQNVTSARKTGQQTTQSQYRQRERERDRDRERERTSRNQQHDHRFDYLMSNLVATQADSNSQLIDQSRVSSRISSFQSSYIHR